MDIFQIDITKFSDETKRKLIRFAQIVPKFHAGWIGVEEKAPDGSPVRRVTTSDEISSEYFSARDDLKTIPEPEVQSLVSQIDSLRILMEAEQRGALPEEMDRVARGIKQAEFDLATLGLRIERTKR